MKAQHLSTILALLLLVVACGNNTEALKEQENNLANEVMDIHDEVMPKMAEINRLSRTLQDYYEANKETISDELDGQIELMQRELEKADDGMMGWMANYQQPTALRETKTHEEIMTYLQEQKKEVSEVAEQINSSLAEAKKLIESLPETEEE